MENELHPDNTAGLGVDSRPRRLPGQLRTSNPNLIRDTVSQATTSHDIRLRGSDIDGFTGSTVLHGTNIVFVRYGGDVVVEAPPTGDRFALTLPLGPMSVGHRDLSDTDVRASGFVLAAARRTLMGPDPWSGALVIATDVSRLHDQLCAVLGHTVDGRLEFLPRRTGREPLPREHLDSAAKLVWQSAARGPLPAPSARLLEQNLLSTVLLAQPHSHMGALLSAPEHVSTPHADAARDWIEYHFAEPVGVVDVAQAVRLSVRQLQTVIMRRYHMTPMELLRDIRLRHARERLLARQADRAPAVSAVAYQCGFTHLGRFSSAYRRRYGQTPSETVQDARRRC